MHWIRLLWHWLRLTLKLIIHGESGMGTMARITWIILGLALAFIPSETLTLAVFTSPEQTAAESAFALGSFPITRIAGVGFLVFWVVFASGQAWGRLTTHRLALESKHDISYFVSKDPQHRDQMCLRYRVVVTNRSPTQTIQNVSVKLLNCNFSGTDGFPYFLREMTSSVPFATSFTLKPLDNLYFDFAEKFQGWDYVTLLCFHRSDGNEEYPTIEPNTNAPAKITLAAYADNMTPVYLDLALFLDSIQRNLQIKPWHQYERYLRRHNAWLWIRLKWEWHSPLKRWRRKFPKKKTPAKD